MDLREAVERHTALHEGRPPDEILVEDWHPPVGSVRVLGEITSITYKKKTPEKFVPYYRHRFRPHARPSFGVDAAGNLWIYAGRYVVTDHGIEDRRPRDVEEEYLPRRPEVLITLGEVVEIGYTAGGANYSYHFPRGGAFLARDPRGDLHVVGDRRIHMAYHVVHRVVRTNPDGDDTGEVLKRVFLTGLVIGGVAAGTNLVFNKILELEALQKAVENPYARAALKAIGGVALSFGAVMMEAPPALAAGLSIGGIGGAIHDIAVLAMQRMAADNASQSSASQGSNPAGNLYYLSPPSAYAPSGAGYIERCNVAR